MTTTTDHWEIQGLSYSDHEGYDLVCIWDYHDGEWVRYDGDDGSCTTFYTLAEAEAEFERVTAQPGMLFARLVAWESDDGGESATAVPIREGWMQDMPDSDDE